MPTCTAADGTSLAWRATGQGPPLVLANGVTTTDVAWGPLLSRWAEGRRVISWDYKGHGASEPARSLDAVTMAALADDLRRVMDAAGVERAPVVGYSMGSQVAFEVYRAIPDRVEAIVSVLGPVRRMLDTALYGIGGRTVEQLLRVLPAATVPAVGWAAKLATRAPGIYAAGRALGLYGSETAPTDIAAYIDHFRRLHMPTVRWMVLAAAEHDATDVLAHADVPVLLVCGGKDVFAPADEVGQLMHAMAPGSKMVLLPDGTHGSPFGHADRIGRVIDEFFADCGL